MASRLQDVLLRGLAAAKPLATAVAPGTLYYSTDLSITERCADSGLVWESYSDAGSGIALPHAATHGFGGSDPVTIAESQVTNLVTDLNGKAPLVHATRHLAAGADPLSVLGLGGYPGGTTTFLRADATFGSPPSGISQLTTDVTAGPGSGTQAATLNPVYKIRTFQIPLDGGGATITTGVKVDVSLPKNINFFTITNWRIIADQPGAISLDLWSDTYANYPPTIADTIVAAAPPNIPATNISNESSTLTGWTVALAGGRTIRVNVVSCTSIQRATLMVEGLVS